MLKRFETKTPIETCCPVHEDEGILESVNGHAVAKPNVEMDDVKVFGGCTVDRLPTWSFTDSGIGPYRDGKFTVVEKFANFGGMDEVPVIPKPTTPS
jgi:hypothetical protein